MTGLLALWIGLLAGGFEPGVGAGGGGIGGEPVAVVRPWIGFEVGALSVSLQAPLRVELDHNRLRPADWDTVGDFARVVRAVRWGEALEAGTLSHLTLGQGTLVRRYHNGVDDDQARGGVRLRTRSGAFEVDAFADQVLAAPVFGGRLAFGGLGERLQLAATLAADSATPGFRAVGPGAGPGAGTGAEPGNEVADPGGAGEETRWLWAFGFDASLLLGDRRRSHGTVYGDLNQVDGGGAGLHLGATYAWITDGLQVRALGEVMFAGTGYDWAVFDTGWLIDRRRGGPTLDGAAALGGRGQVEVDWGGVALVGLAYADVGGDGADGRGRGDASGWLHLGWESLILRGFYRARRPAAGRGLLDVGAHLGALSASVPFMPGLWIETTLAHTWRPRALDGVYRGVTEVLVMLEIATVP